MNPTPTLPTRIVPPSTGQVLHAFGQKVTIQLSGADTGGRLTLATILVPPGGGPPVHYHLNEDETFLPLSGPAEFFHDNAWTTVPAHTAVFLPRGSVHAFRNPGSVPLTMMVQTTPSGFETFFAQCAEVFARPGPPDMARIVAISADFGIHYPAAPNT